MDVTIRIWTFEILQPLYFSVITLRFVCFYSTRNIRVLYLTVLTVTNVEYNYTYVCYGRYRCNLSSSASSGGGSLSDGHDRAGRHIFVRFVSSSSCFVRSMAADLSIN